MTSKPREIYAFPSDINLGDSVDNPNWTCNGGMELRDYFAAKALPSYLHSSVNDLYSPKSLKNIAAFAYYMADAMLEARAK